MLRDCQTVAIRRWRFLITTLQKDQNDPLLQLVNLPRPPVMLNPVGPRHPQPNPLGQPNVLKNPLGQPNILKNPLGQPGALLVGLPKPDAYKELLLQQIEYLRLTAAIVKEMDVFDREMLKVKMRDANPATRWLAIQSALMRRLPCEEELLNRLRDPMPFNRIAAREALVRITRGTDFGPDLPAGATSLAAARAQDEAIANWRQWLKFQEQTPGRSGSR